MNEFNKSKSDPECIMGLKETKQLPTELIWYFKQRFKNLMARVRFHMSNVQHKEWFIATLLPHI